MSANQGDLPYLFSQQGTHPAPFTYTVPPSLEVMPAAATATFNGSGAVNPFLACMSFYAQSGELLSRVFPTAQVQAGDVAQVSFAPFPGGMTAAPAGGGIDFDTLNKGDWLYVETTESGGRTPDGFGMEFVDDGSGGIGLFAATAEVTVGGLGGTVDFRVDSDNGIDLLNAGSSGQLQLDSRSADGIDVRDSYASGAGHGITIESDNNAVSIAGATGLTLLGGDGVTSTAVLSTNAVTAPFSVVVYENKIEFQRGGTPVLRVDWTGLVMEYHILTGASWVADL